MDQDRRSALKAGAAGAAAILTGAAAPAPVTAPPATPATGQPGDFDFLTGEWRISHRFREASGEWIEFVGEATVVGILGGVASIEELRIPARDFSGMGLRLLDVDTRIWTDFWVNAKSGVLTPPGQTGVFEDGVGTFGADDMDGDTPIKVRGVWDRITPTSCRWRQGVSRDGGQTWDESWFMDWRRA